MGLGPPVLELYRQLKILGAFSGVRNVMELGSQDFWCPKQNLVRALCVAFGRPEPPAELLLTTNANQLPARLLYEALGLNYHCVDLDGRAGTLVLDLNFDSAPAEHIGRYDLVTNHGTSEHLINQYNVFKVIHDFARPGGIMVHAVGFTVHLDHGFFNYQPNFFECLARYNSYEILGLWVGPDWQLASLVPWEPALLDFLTLSSKTTHLLVVALRKMYEQPFCAPFQEIYEGTVPDEARSRYAMIIDGEAVDAKRVKYLTGRGEVANEYLEEIQRLKRHIADCRNQIDTLQSDASQQDPDTDALVQGLSRIKTELRLAASAPRRPQARETEFHYESQGQTTSVIPLDPQAASREHGAAIMHIAPRLEPGCTELHFRVAINCYSPEPNVAVLAVFQDGKNHPTALVTEPLSGGETTFWQTEFVVPIEDDAPTAFEIRVGLGQAGGTLRLNYGATEGTRLPNPSLLWVRAYIPGDPIPTDRPGPSPVASS